MPDHDRLRVRLNGRLFDCPWLLTLVIGGLLALGLLAYLRREAGPPTVLPYRRQPLLPPWEHKVLPQLLRHPPLFAEMTEQPPASCRTSTCSRELGSGPFTRLVRCNS